MLYELVQDPVTEGNDVGRRGQSQKVLAGFAVCVGFSKQLFELCGRGLNGGRNSYRKIGGDFPTLDGLLQLTAAGGGEGLETPVQVCGQGHESGRDAGGIDMALFDEQLALPSEAIVVLSGSLLKGQGDSQQADFNQLWRRVLLSQRRVPIGPTGISGPLVGHRNRAGHRGSATA